MIDQATPAQRSGDKKQKDQIVLVAPNGATDEDKFRPHDTVQKTLDRAVKEFGKAGHLDPSRAYQLTRGATSLEPSQTLEQAGVEPGDRLNVRIKEIPADGDAPGA